MLPTVRSLATLYGMNARVKYLTVLFLYTGLLNHQSVKFEIEILFTYSTVHVLFRIILKVCVTPLLQ